MTSSPRCTPNRRISSCPHSTRLTLNKLSSGCKALRFDGGCEWFRRCLRPSDARRFRLQSLMQLHPWKGWFRIYCAWDRVANRPSWKLENLSALGSRLRLIWKSRRYEVFSWVECQIVWVNHKLYVLTGFNSALCHCSLRPLWSLRWLVALSDFIDSQLNITWHSGLLLRLKCPHLLVLCSRVLKLCRCWARSSDRLLIALKSDSLW